MAAHPCVRPEDGPLDPAPVDGVSRGPNRHEESQVPTGTRSRSVSTPRLHARGREGGRGHLPRRGFRSGGRRESRAPGEGRTQRAGRSGVRLGTAAANMWFGVFEGEENSVSHADTVPREPTESIQVSNANKRGPGPRTPGRRPTSRHSGPLTVSPCVPRVRLPRGRAEILQAKHPVQSDRLPPGGLSWPPTRGDACGTHTCCNARCRFTVLKTGTEPLQTRSR